MPEQPLVSIGMPVYNSEWYVRRALELLLGQDRENPELIISDDGSTDATVEICREYAKSDRRISLHGASENAGPLASSGCVLERAWGEYFMWAANDDYREANHIARAS